MEFSFNFPIVDATPGLGSVSASQATLVSTATARVPSTRMVPGVTTCAPVTTLPTVTHVTARVFAPQAGWGPGVTRRVHVASMAVGVSTSVSVPMGPRVNIPLANVNVLQVRELIFFLLKSNHRLIISLETFALFGLLFALKMNLKTFLLVFN